MSGMGEVWRQLLGIALGGAYALSANCADAQITPDRTLPNNSSVTINGSVFNITGGTQAGRNLTPYQPEGEMQEISTLMLLGM